MELRSACPSFTFIENALSTIWPNSVATGRYVCDKCDAIMYRVHSIFASLPRYALNCAACALIIV